eukprot:TRINITY_DN5436_c0_g1_i2.p1 TRINITY_DN5436_c0_g1~~TRINITY_DN5436_c0_g1_i2.p1  ORF type:complete len:110 (-),score=6.73 TRINITY_DN5436_c0_g1_i2:39-368(-)
MGNLKSRAEGYYLHTMTSVEESNLMMVDLLESDLRGGNKYKDLIYLGADLERRGGVPRKLRLNENGRTPGEEKQAQGMFLSPWQELLLRHEGYAKRFDAWTVKRINKEV